MDPIEIVRERIALYENAKAEMASYERKIFEKAEWLIDGSPAKRMAYEMGFEPTPEEKKERIGLILDELRLIEKEMMGDD